MIVVGASAAGMMCAATAGQGGRRSLLIDHAVRPGEKIPHGNKTRTSELLTCPSNIKKICVREDMGADKNLSAFVIATWSGILAYHVTRTK